MSNYHRQFVLRSKSGDASSSFPLTSHVLYFFLFHALSRAPFLFLSLSLIDPILHTVLSPSREGPQLLGRRPGVGMGLSYIKGIQLNSHF